MTVAAAGESAASAMMAVGWFFNQIEGAIPSIVVEYATSPIFRFYPGWPEAYMLAHPVWFGFVFAAGFTAVNRLRPTRGWIRAWSRGVGYGALLFVIGSLPILAMVYASFKVSLLLIAVSWASRNLAQYVIAGGCVGFATEAGRVIVERGYVTVTLD